MKMVYLIGNGFDINLGLDTRYSDFYKIYNRTNSNNKDVLEFKNSIKSETELWSDLELGLAKHTDAFSKENINNFIFLLDDIQDNLAEYIKSEDWDFTLSKYDEDNFIDDLCHPEKYLRLDEKKEIEIYKNMNNTNVNISVINFNYTDTFSRMIASRKDNKFNVLKKNNDELITYKFNEEVHVHGTTEENMLIGVNDTSQIVNESFRNDVFFVNNFVKKQMNNNTKKFIEEKCIKLIEEAGIICIFGMSFGETDKCWWELILNQLKEDKCKVIVFNVDKEFHPRRSYRIDYYSDRLKKKLLKYSSNFSVSEKNSIKNNIYTCLNTDMFKITRIFVDNNLEIMYK